MESIYHIIHSALYDPNGEPRAEQVSRATGDGFTELVLEVVSPAFLARRGISKYHINVVWSHTKERPLRKAGHTGCLPFIQTDRKHRKMIGLAFQRFCRWIGRRRKCSPVPGLRVVPV